MAVQSALCRQVLSIVLTIISILSSPLLILLLPVYFVRMLVGQASKIFRKDLGKMLSPRGNLFAVEYSTMFKSHARCIIYVSHVCDGKIDLDEFRQLILDKVVHLKLPEKSDEYANPELRQTISKWLGYLFWQWDKDFRIENHIRMYNGPGKTDLVYDDDIPFIMKYLSCEPFSPGRSPWEFWIWHNARLRRDPDSRPKSILLLRIHHSLADGYSVLKLLLEDIAGKKILTACTQPKPVKAESVLQIVCKFIGLLVKAPYELINLSIQSWDFNQWHIPESQLTGKLNSAISRPISVDYIKDIKNVYGTSFNAVLQAAFTGGIRNFMMEQGIKVPKTLHCMTPLVMKGHPSKLRNHMTAFIAPLPVGIEDPRDRIRSVDASLKALHKSTVPLATFYMLPFIGALPAWVIKILATNVIATCLMTNFPAPSDQVHLLGLPVDDIMFGGGLLVGNIGIGMSSLSYNGAVRLGAGGDEAILQDPELVQSLIRKIEEELDILREIV